MSQTHMQGGPLPNKEGYPPDTGGYPPNVGIFPPSEQFGAQQANLPYPMGQTTAEFTLGQQMTSGGFPANQAPPGGFPPNQQAPSGNFQPTVGGFPQTQPPPGGFPTADNLTSSTGALSGPANLPGFEGLTIDGSALKPPPSAPAVQPTENQQIFQKAPSLTEEQVKDALAQFVAEHCCYGSAAAKEMIIRDIQFKSAIHYVLDTYGEKRETAWTFEPYQSCCPTPVQIGGHTPGPWEIAVGNDAGDFQNCQKCLEVPNSSNLRPCHKCLAMGRTQCENCHGRGRKHCVWCHGSGRRDSAHCTSCSGSGWDRCFSCDGEGQVTCKVCKGQCQLRYYIKMTVTWTNHSEDHVSECTAVPNVLIREVTGDTAFHDQQPRVWPVSNFPDAAVNHASHRLVEKHGSAFPDERILQQRQVVRIVPIAEVNYDWKSQHGAFHIYGFENKVYFPDYPQTCCCGCQIM